MTWDSVMGVGGGRYVTLTPNTQVRIRLLLAEDISGIPPEPFTVWYHRIFSVKDSSGETKRTYSTEVCQFETDGRGVCRCGLCGEVDPLYDILSEDDQKQDGEGKPIHFPRVAQHLTLVWNYETNRVEILKQGTNLFKKLFAIRQARGHLNMDVKIWKQVEGQGGKRGTTYEAQALNDSAFDGDVLEDDLPSLTASETPTPMDQLQLIVSGELTRKAIANGNTGQKQIPAATTAKNKETVKKTSSKLANLRNKKVVDAEVVSDDEEDSETVSVDMHLDMVCTEGTKYKNKTLRHILENGDLKYMKFMAKNAKSKDLAAAFDAVVNAGVDANSSPKNNDSMTPEEMRDKVVLMIEEDSQLSDGDLLVKLIDDSANNKWGNDVKYDFDMWLEADGGDKAIAKLYNVVSSGDYSKFTG